MSLGYWATLSTGPRRYPPTDPNPDLRIFASVLASIAWFESGLPRSLHASGKRDGEPTTMSLCMDMHNKVDGLIP